MAPAGVAGQGLASLNVLSQGRVDVALGVGGRQQDYDALGAPFTGRFGRLDRTAAELRRLWAGGLMDEAPGGGGDGADGGHPVGPTPVQPGGPRLLCSGTGPQSLARAARWADGLSSFALEAARPRSPPVYGLADAAWADAGRAERPRRVTGTLAALGPGAEATLHAYARRYLDVFGTDLAAVLAAAMPVHTDEALHTFLTGLAAGGRRGDPGGRRQRPRPGQAVRGRGRGLPRRARHRGNHRAHRLILPNSHATIVAPFQRANRSRVEMRRRLVVAMVGAAALVGVLTGCNPLTGIQQVATGGAHACALHTNST